MARRWFVCIDVQSAEVSPNGDRGDWDDDIVIDTGPVAGFETEDDAIMAAEKLARQLD
jgi:hypothetical protein